MINDIFWAFFSLAFVLFILGVLVSILVLLLADIFPDAAARLRKKIENKLMTWLGDV